MHFRPLDFALSLSLKDTLNLRSFGYTPMYHTSFFMIFQAGHNGDNFVHDFHDFEKFCISQFCMIFQLSCRGLS